MRLALTAVALSAALSGPVPLVARVWIPYLPAAVKSDGMRIIAFEVVASGVGGCMTKPVDLTISGLDSKRPLVRYEAEELVIRSTEEAAREDDAVARGRQIRIFVELVLPLGAASPGTIFAVIGCKQRDGTRREFRSAALGLDVETIPVLAAPLAGGPWVAVHDARWKRGHRRVIYTEGGRDRVPGRYAIDWVGVGEDGRISNGDPDRPADAVGYGTPVHAGADAIVAAVRDGMHESRSIAANSVQSKDGRSGNHVVLKIGPRRYAVYEHLKPGSIAVRVGQRVRVGQVIGALGFTCDSTGPHLHLHVADCASPLTCEGVPFMVRGMTEFGRYKDLGDLGQRRWTDNPARGRLRPEWPGYNIVIKFSKKGSAKDSDARHGDRKGGAS